MTWEIAIQHECDLVLIVCKLSHLYFEGWRPYACDAVFITGLDSAHRRSMCVWDRDSTSVFVYFYLGFKAFCTSSLRSLGILYVVRLQYLESELTLCLFLFVAPAASAQDVMPFRAFVWRSTLSMCCPRVRFVTHVCCGSITMYKRARRPSGRGKAFCWVYLLFVSSEIASVKMM